MRPVTRLLACATAVALIAALTSSTAQLQNRNSVLTLAAGDRSSLSELREADSLVDQLGRDGALRLAASERDLLVPGRTHDRFRQYHDGVPIFGAEVTRQTARGVTVSLFGTLHLGVEVETTPALSRDEATRIIERLDNVRPGGSTPPRLVVLPDRERAGVYRLVYEARAFTGTRLMAFFIDASTGDLVWAYDDLKTQQPVLPCEQCAIGEGLGVKGDRKKIMVTAVGGAFLAQDQLRPADVFTFDMDGDMLRTLDVLDQVDAATGDVDRALRSLDSVSRTLRQRRETINGVLRDVRPAARVLRRSTPRLVELLSEVESFAEVADDTVRRTREDLLSALRQAGPVIRKSGNFSLCPQGQPATDLTWLLVNLDYWLEPSLGLAEKAADELRQGSTELRAQILAIESGEQAADAQLQAAVDKLNPNTDYHSYSRN